MNSERMDTLVKEIGKMSVLSIPDVATCSHDQTIMDETGFQVCTLCGLQIETEQSYEKEWRFYGVNDSRNISNPTRCHLRLADDRSIYKDLEGKHIPDAIIDLANDMFLKVTTDSDGERKIKRSNSRQEIIFGCVFEAYKQLGEPQNPNKLALKFELKNQKGISRGIKKVISKLNTTKKYINAIDLVPQILNELGSEGHQHLEKITGIYEFTKNKSQILKRCNPQSFASGLVFYYYQTLKNKNCSKKEFSEKVGLSEITILKISNEIDRILDLKK